MTNFTFEDTLTQIGLGYFPLFLLGLARPRVRWIALGVILVGYWAGVRGLPAARGRLRLPGRRRQGRLAAPRHRLRRALEQEQQPGLGVRPLVPQPVSPGKPLHAQRRRLRDAQLHPDPGDDDPGPDRRRLAARAGESSRGKLGRLVLAGAVGVGARPGARPPGLCPIVKRIWTPSWVLFSGGICFGVLGAALRPDRPDRLHRVDVPAPGDRPELDRRLLSWPT